MQNWMHRNVAAGHWKASKSGCALLEEASTFVCILKSERHSICEAFIWGSTKISVHPRKMDNARKFGCRPLESIQKWRVLLEEASTFACILGEKEAPKIGRRASEMHRNLCASPKWIMHWNVGAGQWKASKTRCRPLEMHRILCASQKNKSETDAGIIEAWKFRCIPQIIGRHPWLDAPY
jgi:hypothetical protein